MTDLPRMIVVNLIGGLGNQMFQYACGFALGRELELPVKLCTDMFDTYTLHNGPELHHVFPISSAVADIRDMQSLLGSWRARPGIRKLLEHHALKVLRNRYFIVERQIPHSQNLCAAAKDGAYLQGYWQSEQYFANHSDALRKQFGFHNPPDGRNAELINQIRGDVSVSLHARRGDYAHCPRTRAFHGLCEPEYYLRAIDFLRRRVAKFRLFAFSDDPQWVAETLKAAHSDMVIVNHNRGNQSYNDMRLMSMCNHHIIANSSFSWWGAWLNADPDKIVIAPRKWFVYADDTADLIPETWIRL